MDRERRRTPGKEDETGRGTQAAGMSRYRDRDEAPGCGRGCRGPLLRMLAEHVDSNKRIEELLEQEEEQRNVRREKLATARLWSEALRTKSRGTMWEKLMQKLEEEQALRLDWEKHQGVTEGSEVSRGQMVLLQQHFSRMEETVRTLLQNPGGLDPSSLDTVELMKAYKDKLSEEVRKRRESLAEASRGVEEEARLQADCRGAEEDRDKEATALLERLRALEAENSALARENESQRAQYEKCLDEVANQVVQALLTQKDLREECLRLRTRVFDLEQQNRALSFLVQQRVRPTSDLLLQKLHSRILGLSAGDLLLDPEKSKHFLLSRSADSPLQDGLLNGKAGGPAGRFSSQLSVTVPAGGGAGGYLRASSCSSSELSLSSACSDFSSGSYTWNEGRASSKPSSLNWEKRSSLGSSAPSSICAPTEEQLPARKKECHILQGLRRLQRRKPKESSRSGASKSGYKDCMNSNEGIYSLGTKCVSQGAPKPSPTNRSDSLWSVDKGFPYDSDDADDEYPRPCSTDRWDPSHGKFSGLCGREEKSNAGVPVAATKRPAIAGYDSKERPEKLTSFLSGFLFGGRTRTAVNRSLPPCEASHAEPALSHPRHSDSEPEASEGSGARLAAQPESDPRRLSRRVAEQLAPRVLRKDHYRAQSADSRPRPLSLVDRLKVSKGAQSEECIAVVFNSGDGRPVQYGSPRAVVLGPNGILRRRPQSEFIGEYTQPAHQGRPTCRRGSDVRNYSVLESPEKPVELHSPGMGRTHNGEGPQQQKPTRSPHNRAHKGHSVPPMVNGASSPKANSTKIPGRSKESPLKVSAEIGSGGGSLAPPSQERSPSSPPVKLSKFGRAPGSGYSAQSPRAAHPNSKLPCRTDWGKGPTSSIPGSPLLMRRHLEPMDCGELPTHDVGQQLELRSPSPPPPPGRSTSLLIRPNYEGTPQALKPGVHQNTPSTVRVAPHGSLTHPNATSSMLNIQHPGAHKSQDHTALWDASYNTEAVPQRLVDGPSHHLQKSPASCRTALRGSPKKVTAKLYPSSVSDLHDTVSTGSKNSMQKGLSLQNANCGKKGHLPGNGYLQLYKSSGSLPLSLQGHSLDVTGSTLQPSQAISDCTVLGLSPHNSAERVTKTRIPIGLKALVKSPVLLRESSSVSEQQDKDYVNIASKVSATSSTFNLREAPQRVHGLDAASGKSRGGMRPEVRCSSMDVELLPPVVAEDGSLCDEFDAEGRLFKRSISVTTKPHLKPALGMNGAKARSQSFSTHYMQKPSVGASEGSRVRTHIITNTGDRGSSLTRQSSLGDGFQHRSAGGSRESLPQTAVNIRQGFNGVMSGSNSNHGLPSKSAPRASAQKEVRSLPLIDRLGPKTSRQPAKVASHPHFDSESFAFYSPEPQVEGVGKRLVATNKFDPTRSISKQAGGGGEEPEKLLSPSACTIEEKVMMGIQENVQRGQEQNKSQASEAKHKTGSSIANWFGFRKSKLPALGGKKNDTPKGKEEKKENKIGSVLGGRQTKPDKTKDKKKTEMQCTDSQNQTITDSRDKLGSIMDQCHFQTGQHTNHIQHSMSYAGKDQFMKEIVIRSVTKGSSHSASLPGIPNSPQGIPVEKRGTKEDIEIHGDAKSQSATQKISLRAEREADLEPEANCQDNMIGSGCQTRTLDSGIGTFPLPDSVARATGRHLPKSTSTPPGQALGAPAGPADDLPPTSPPESQVPSKCSPRAPPVPGHSPADCGVSHRGVSDTQTRLAKPTASGVMRGKRLSQSEFGTGPEDHGKEKEKRRSANQSPPTDRRPPFCSFSGGSSSDSKMDAKHDPSAPCLGHDSSLNGTRKTRQEYPEEAELRKGSVENHLSIMDCYQRDVLIQYRREELREAEQYSSSDRERKPQQRKSESDDSADEGRRSIFPGVSLESLNQLNSDGGPFPEPERGNAPDRAAGRGPERRNDEPSSSCSDKAGTDNPASLSDSLYDSFSSCASQGSHDA